MKKIILLITVISFGICNNILAQKNSERKPLQKVLTAYLDLKDALVMDDSVKAKEAATTLCTAIDTMNIDKLTLLHKTAWTKQSVSLLSQAKKIQNSATLASQRTNFKTLSVSMHKLLGKLNINKGVLYYQYCETANAYWISADKLIKNPYFGKKQIDCGYTKAELKANK